MASLRNITEKIEGVGWLGVGVGAAILAPIVVPGLGRALRPAAKGLVKGYLALAELTRERLAEAGEQWQDIVAEVRAEQNEGAGAAGAMTSAEDRPARARRSSTSRKSTAGAKKSGPTTRRTRTASKKKEEGSEETS